MNLRAIIVAFCLLFSHKAFSQIEYKYTQKLGVIATVAMPDTPKLVEVKGSKQYVATYKGVIFQAAFGSTRKGLKDIFSSSSQDSFYSEYITGFLEGTKGKLIYKDKIKINGHDAIQFCFKGNAKNQTIYGYYRTVSLGDTVVTCGIIASDFVPKNNKNLTDFFDKFKVKSVTELDDLENESRYFKIGQGIGVLMVIGLVVLFGLAIVLVLKKIVYRKHRT